MVAVDFSGDLKRCGAIKRLRNVMVTCEQRYRLILAKCPRYINIDYLTYHSVIIKIVFFINKKSN